MIFYGWLSVALQRTILDLTSNIGRSFWYRKAARSIFLCKYLYTSAYFLRIKFLEVQLLGLLSMFLRPLVLDAELFIRKEPVNLPFSRVRECSHPYLLSNTGYYGTVIIILFIYFE